MQGKIAKWWMPDDVAFVEEIPHTATGKILKTELRERFKDYRLPTAADECVSAHPLGAVAHHEGDVFSAICGHASPPQASSRNELPACTRAC